MLPLLYYYFMVGKTNKNKIITFCLLLMPSFKIVHSVLLIGGFWASVAVGSWQDKLETNNTKTCYYFIASTDIIVELNVFHWLFKSGRIMRGLLLLIVPKYHITGFCMYLVLCPHACHRDRQRCLISRKSMKTKFRKTIIYLFYWD